MMPRTVTKCGLRVSLSPSVAADQDPSAAETMIRSFRALASLWSGGDVAWNDALFQTRQNALSEQ